MTDDLKSKPLTPTESVYIDSQGLTQLSMRWFVPPDGKEDGEVAFAPRSACEITPLVNGANAFGALEQAICSATRTIDYITWGFDPSMRFTDGGPSIGEVLLRRLDECKTLEVRILVWYGGYFDSIMYGVTGDSGKTEIGQPHKTANLPGYDESPGEKSKYVKAAKWYEKAKKQPRLHFETRPLDLVDTDRAVRFDRDIRLGIVDVGEYHALTKFATHHQKMVLIDYAEPLAAVGFVMGSNTLQRYWDTSEHPLHHENRRTDYEEKVEYFDQVGRKQSYTRPASAYFQPWQDVSARLRGAVLFDLHTNFARAWKRAGGKTLEPARRAITPASFAALGDGPMQLLRTQPQENAKTIKDMYFRNVRNARNFIYFENQYFRLHELVDDLGKAARALQAGGRRQSLYLFVVCNVPEESTARLSTYQMLAALGQGEQMPRMHHDPLAKNLASAPHPMTQGAEQAGLQTVVCTLTACENLNYQPIYTHSKVMVIDDNFFTLGSANLNRRNMLSDSELNIAVPNAEKAAALRKELWGVHRGEAPDSETFAEFGKWTQVALTNLTRSQKKNEKLSGHLTLFMDNGPPVYLTVD